VIKTSKSTRSTQAIVLALQTHTPAFNASQHKDPLRSSVLQGVAVSSMMCIWPRTRGSKRERNWQKNQLQCNSWENQRTITTQQILQKRNCSSTAPPNGFANIQAVLCSSVTGMHLPFVILSSLTISKIEFKNVGFVSNKHFSSKR